jgi:hypothetical protein
MKGLEVLMRTFTGGRRLGLRPGLAIAVATAALSLAPSAANAAFTLQPCHGSATAGRGATFPALLHNSGFWGTGFDSGAGCGNVAGAPTHPTYNSGTIDSDGQSSNASATGSGGGVGACGGGAGGWKAGHRDMTVRFCATDDPVTVAQLTNADAGCDTYHSPIVCTPGVLHQLPWASGAVTIAIHLPEGCTLPAPGTTGQANSQTTGWTDNGGTTKDPSGDSATGSVATPGFTSRPLISDAKLEKALAGDPSEQFWGQLVPNMTGAPVTSASGDSQDNGLSCTGTSSGTNGIPIIRIVRSDNSGTTFNFKSFLGLVAGSTIGGDPTVSTSWTGSVSNTGGTALNSTAAANTAWPVGGSFSTVFNAGGGSHQTDANSICEWNTTVFPAANAQVTADQICGGHGTGASNVALGVDGTDGSIGYVDIATARNTKYPGVPAAQQDLQDVQTNGAVTRDYTFWLPVQNCPDQAAGCTQSYQEPTNDQTNHLVSGSGEVGTPNAACKNLPNLQNVPSAASSPNGDATLGDWSKTIAVGGSGYPVCVLTYGLVWDDNAAVYGNNAGEQAQARTVLDYVKFVASDFGQSFIGQDFSSTPANIQNIMRTGTADGTGHGGVAAIDFNKTQCTTNCGGTTTTPVTTTTTTPIVKPPPPSNKFTISSPHTKGKNLVLTLKLPGGGKIRVTATFTFKHHKVTFASLSSTVRGGNGTVTLKPTGAAVRDFGKTPNNKTIKVTITITFTPTGGVPHTSSITLKVHGTHKGR